MDEGASNENKIGNVWRKWGNYQLQMRIRVSSEFYCCKTLRDELLKVLPLHLLEELESAGKRDLINPLNICNYNRTHVKKERFN
jgi:hypothetical protein